MTGNTGVAEPDLRLRGLAERAIFLSYKQWICLVYSNFCLTMTSRNHQAAYLNNLPYRFNFKICGTMFTTHGTSIYVILNDSEVSVKPVVIYYIKTWCS